MTLFEAIRKLKEGQQIVCPGEAGLNFRLGERVIVRWQHGSAAPEIVADYLLTKKDEWAANMFAIIDLPLPKMTLEEGLRAMMLDAWKCGWEFSYDRKGEDLGKSAFAELTDILRSMPIDWQAEADRKEKG